MYVREGGSHWVRGFTGALVIVVAVLGFVVWSPVRTPVTEFGFHASLVDQGPPPALLPGSTTTYSMHFRNVGLVAWQRGTDKQVTLGVNGDALTYADAGMAVDWLSPARIVSTSEELVLPGTIGTFSFKMRAPATPGTYKVPVRLVVEGLAWLDHDPITVEITSDLGFHSRLVDQSAHVILKPGEMSGPLTLHVRNTGAKTWTRGVTGQQANLGLSGDDKALSILGVGWPSADRVAVQTEPSVGPGGIATFTFRVRAPFAPGTYALRLRPVVDGLTWLEDEGIVTLVTVLGPAGATPTPVLGEAFKNVQPINFAFDATADPREVAPGKSVAINATVGTGSSGNALIGVEVYAPGGATLAYQKWFHNESFTAGQAKSYAARWDVPPGTAAGTYTVNVSAYAEGWKARYAAKAPAATFSVDLPVVIPPSPQPTATAAPSGPSFTAAPLPSGAPSPTGSAAPTVAPTASPASTPAPAQTFSSTTSFSATSVSAGGSVGLTNAVTSATATTALVDIEVWATGAASAIYQVWFDDQAFAAGQQRTYTATWQIPADAALGTYTVKVGVYAPQWAALYAMTTGGTFTVVPAAPAPTPVPTVAPTAAPTSVPTAPPTPVPTTAPTAVPTVVPTAVPTVAPTPTLAPTLPPTPVPTPVPTVAPSPTSAPTTAPTPVPSPSFGSTSTLVPTTVAAGTSVTITSRVTSATAVTALVNIEIYAPGAPTSSYQVWYDNQSFAAGQQRTYTTTWSVPSTLAAGTYKVAIGVYAPGWTTLYTLTDPAGTFTITSAAPTIAPTPVPTPVPTGVPTPTPAPTATPAPPPGGLSPLHVQGNKLVNAAGQIITLHGMNHSGTEYACVQGWGLGDGVGAYTQAAVTAIKSWKTVNAVRVPLNEDCWLAINGVPAAYAGANYQTFIKNWVTLLNQNGIYAVLELKWTAPGSTPATTQVPMPDMDHSPTFWTQVANAYKGNNAVIFELFNEPYPDNQQNSTAAWTCWRDGGTCSGVSYQAAGMQTLVNAVRGTGATNVLALGGVSWSNALYQWLAYKPVDPLNNLAAVWHVYNFNICSTVSCYNANAGPVLAQVPLIVTETGADNCDPTWWNTYLSWLDTNGASYLAWVWNTWGSSCSTLSLITDYAGTPTQMGLIYKNHLAGLP